MNRTTNRMCLAAAASMIVLTGASPTWATDPAAQPPQTEKMTKAANKASQRTFKRMQRDLSRLVNRLSADMRDAVQPNYDAMVDLGQGEPNKDDLDALVKAFGSTLDEAAAAAEASFSEQAAKRREDLKSKGASEKMMARADAMIARMKVQLDRRADRLDDRFEDRMSERFETYVMPNESDCPHGDPTPTEPVPPAPTGA